ncbi:MAG: DUF998 domain-containing protein [Rhodospirillaceae bacterium]
MTTTQHPHDDIIISYLGLRKFIGVLGLGLPFVLIAGNLLIGRDGQRGLQPSISDYYYTVMEGVFVGALCAIAAFLFSYRGYDWRDRVAGLIAGAAALLVAWFPTTPDADKATEITGVGIVHFTAAGVFFFTLAYFCLYLFTRTRSIATMSPRKRTRNRIYRICGWTIVGAFVALAVYFVFFKTTALTDLKPVLWLEIAMIVPFGISWLVKGEFILRDE